VLDWTDNFSKASLLTFSLTGGAYWPPAFLKACSSKSYKVKKFGKIIYYTEIILAVRLTSNVPSKKAV
jgi:hypothetical protein